MTNPDLCARYDIADGTISDAPLVRRHLGDLKGCFVDQGAYATALAAGNPLLYSVAAMEPGAQQGDLHYGLGVLMPGRVGAEYYLTKGHYHAWRPAAEVYMGLSGEGYMLLEDEHSGESRLLPLGANKVVYVPGHTAHRTINTGNAPLAYMGIYPAAAGHDYASLAQRNFRKVVVERNGRPELRDRTDYA